MFKKTGSVSQAQEWLSNDSVFLDTETTGLYDKAQIIEIAICDGNGETLLQSYVKPTEPVSESAFQIHGIGDDQLKFAPIWLDIVEQVREILERRIVVIYCKQFDTRVLMQTSAAYGLPIDWIASLNTQCAMQLAANYYGATNKYGSISLINATKAAGVKWRGNAHNALVDALATLDVVRSIAADSGLKRN